MMKSSPYWLTFLVIVIGLTTLILSVINGLYGSSFAASSLAAAIVSTTPPPLCGNYGPLPAPDGGQGGSPTGSYVSAAAAGIPPQGTYGCYPYVFQSSAAVEPGLDYESSPSQCPAGKGLYYPAGAKSYVFTFVHVSENVPYYSVASSGPDKTHSFCAAPATPPSVTCTAAPYAGTNPADGSYANVVFTPHASNLNPAAQNYISWAGSVTASTTAIGPLYGYIRPSPTTTTADQPEFITIYSTVNGVTTHVSASCPIRIPAPALSCQGTLDSSTDTDGSFTNVSWKAKLTGISPSDMSKSTFNWTTKIADQPLHVEGEEVSNQFSDFVLPGKTETADVTVNAGGWIGKASCQVKAPNVYASCAAAAVEARDAEGKEVTNVEWTAAPQHTDGASSIEYEWSGDASGTDKVIESEILPGKKAKASVGGRVLFGSGNNQISVDMLTDNVHNSCSITGPEIKNLKAMCVATTTAGQATWTATYSYTYLGQKFTPQPTDEATYLWKDGTDGATDTVDYDFNKLPSGPVTETNSVKVNLLAGLFEGSESLSTTGMCTAKICPAPQLTLTNPETVTIFGGKEDIKSTTSSLFPFGANEKFSVTGELWKNHSWNEVYVAYPSNSNLQGFVSGQIPANCGAVSLKDKCLAVSMLVNGNPAVQTHIIPIWDIGPRKAKVVDMSLGALKLFGTSNTSDVKVTGISLLDCAD